MRNEYKAIISNKELTKEEQIVALEELLTRVQAADVIAYDKYKADMAGFKEQLLDIIGRDGIKTDRFYISLIKNEWKDDGQERWWHDGDTFTVYFVGERDGKEYSDDRSFKVGKTTMKCGTTSYGDDMQYGNFVYKFYKKQMEIMEKTPEIVAFFNNIDKTNYETEKELSNLASTITSEINGLKQAIKEEAINARLVEGAVLVKPCYSYDYETKTSTLVPGNELEVTIKKICPKIVKTVERQWRTEYIERGMTPYGREQNSSLYDLLCNVLYHGYYFKGDTIPETVEGRV